MSEKPLITLVVARADNGVIGQDGALPWRLRGDMRHFREVTMGKPMIMGRKTFESLPKLLDGRRHIVLTTNRAWQRDGAEPAYGVEEALRLAGGTQEVAVIGGAEIYGLFADIADRVWLTRVHASPEGDTFLPDFDASDWMELSAATGDTVGAEPPHDFVLLERR